LSIIDEHQVLTSRITEGENHKL